MKRKDQADSAAVIPNQTQLRQLNQTGNSLKSQLHNNNYVWKGGGERKTTPIPFKKHTQLILLIARLMLPP